MAAPSTPQGPWGGLPLSQCSQSSLVSKLEPFKLVMDPVHGLVEMEAGLVQLLDTPQFQRLRDLKQLGCAYFVFPGASHNRFEHSIGCAHLAGQLASSLRRRQPELGISADDVLSVQMAGLLHDLGHGPFSHVFDCEFIPRVLPGVKWSHEDASVMMMDYLLDDNGVDLEPERRRILHELVNPYEYPTQSMRGREFLYDIVANSRTGLDVDKLDYLARDCLNTGIKANNDFSRLFKNCRVIDGQMCYHAKEVQTCYDVFATRFSLFKRVYSHRTVKAVEYMICDVLTEANQTLRIADAIQRPEDYVRLTDCVLKTIETSDDPALRKAQGIIGDLRRRNLYQLVGQALLPRGLDVALPRVRAVDITTMQPAGGTLRPEDIVVHDMRLNYGMKDQNPVDRVQFFRNWDAAETFRVSQDKVSHIIPSAFQERHVRVYLRSPQDEAKLAASIEAFQRWLRRHKCKSPNPAFVLEHSDVTASPVPRPHVPRTGVPAAAARASASAAASPAAVTNNAAPPAASPGPSMSPCPTPRKRGAAALDMTPKNLGFARPASKRQQRGGESGRAGSPAAAAAAAASSANHVRRGDE